MGTWQDWITGFLGAAGFVAFIFFLAWFMGRMEKRD